MKTQIVELPLSDQKGQPVTVLLERSELDPKWRLKVSGDRPVDAETLNPDPSLVRTVNALTFADFADAGASLAVAVLTLPSRSLVKAVVLEVSAAFTGGTVSAAVVDVGVTGTADALIADANVFAGAMTAVSNNAAVFLSGTAVSVTLTVTGDTLAALTQGALTLHVHYEVLPEA